MVSFTGCDSTSILSLLESYKMSYECSDIIEGLGIQILPYFLKASPNQMLIAYMRHWIVSYPKFINFLLDKYASNETIIQTPNEINNLQKLQNRRASDFADFIRSRISCSGSA